MSSRVEKAGSLRFKPTARTASSGAGAGAGATPIDKPVATPIRPMKAGAGGGAGGAGGGAAAAATTIEQPSQQPVPLPIARRPSVTGVRDQQQNNTVTGSSSAASGSGPPLISSSPSVRGGRGARNVTKSYVGVKGGGGVPIFVGPNPPLSRAGSMAPPPSSNRRSQTPQLQQPSSSSSVHQRRTSVPRDLLTPSRQANGGGEHDGQVADEEDDDDDGVAASSSSIIARPSAAPTTSIPNANSAKGAKATSSSSSSSSLLRKPANPPSAYVLFSQKVRPRLTDEAATPEGASFNITARVRQEWTALSEEERKEFQEEAAQRRQTWESLMDDYNAGHHPDGGAAEAAVRGRSSQTQSKAAKKRKTAMPASSHAQGGEEPSRDPFEIFRREFNNTTKDDVVEGGAELAWKGLTSRQRQKYELEAQLAEEAYLDKMLSEEGGATGAKTTERRSSKKQARTISDDEAEYVAEVAEHGPALKTRRVDTRSTSMADLSALTFKRGRASARTFDMERKLKEQARERQRQLKRERAAREKGDAAAADDEEDVSPPPSDSQAPKTTSERRKEGGGPEEEEIIDEGVEEEGEEGGAGAQSDVESVGTASEMMPALRDDRFTVRTRIVDGQIVLDESSLQQERSNEAGMDGVGQEYVDVNEEDRFVNSATYSKRVGTERWDAQETRAFLEAVSMWGSDFEMISRMFPKRNRKQIRAKWRSLERTDSRSLDLAFKRKLPVNLEAYGLMAGVDLSGEAPQIEARVIKKAEGEEEEEEGAEQQDAQEKEVERDEDGREIVDESDAPPRVVRKKSATPGRMAKSKSPSVVRTTEEDGDGEELPTSGQIIQSARAKRSRSERESSIASATTSHKSRLGAGSTTAAGAAPSSSAGASATPTAAAEAERLRQEKKLQDQQRKERERLRRRAVPSNAEEIVDG